MTDEDQDDPTLMDFADAMRAVQDSLSVRRELWDDRAAQVAMKDGKLQIRIGDTWRPWLITEPDVKAKDWTV